MKNIIKLSIATLALLAITVLGLQAQPYGPYVVSLTNNVSVATIATTNLSSAYAALYRGRGLSIVAPIASSANTANSVTNFSMVFQFSQDKTNWVGDTTLSANANGTTGILFYTNWPANGYSTTLPAIDNMAWIRLKSVTWTGLGYLNITNVWVGIFP